jgi:Kinesin motor domain
MGRDFSHRSHAILQFHIKQQLIAADGVAANVKSSVFTVVDLAGSERVAKTGTQVRL